MKLQVKTLSQKTLSIDIDETKTVYDLKRELSLYPDIGVSPEYQKLIYSGKILSNHEVLETCNIDNKKFLVVMVLKHPIVDEFPSVSTAADEEKDKKEESADKKEEKAKEEAKVEPKTEATTSEPNKAKENTDELVQQIVSMGYVESDVRAALKASYNNPERAIEYLIEGCIPTENDVGNYADWEEEELSPFELFRQDPIFRELRRSIAQNPELINDAIARIAEANPSFLEIIDENHEEFTRLLLQSLDDDSDAESDMG